MLHFPMLGFCATYSLRNSPVWGENLVMATPIQFSYLINGMIVIIYLQIINGFIIY